MLLQEFKEMVLSNEVQFDLQNDGKAMFFVKRRIGKATYIMGGHSYYGNFKLDTELKVQAIEADGVIYITDSYAFYPIKEEEYPSNVFCFNSKLKEFNNYVSTVLFKAFYDALPIRELTPTEENYVSEITRNTILKDDGAVKDITLEDIISEEKFAKYISGDFNVEDYAKLFFEKRKDSFIEKKSIAHRLSERIAEKHNTFEWEIKLAKSLKELDAKTVNVEFTFNGKVASEKVQKERLLSMLYHKGYFSGYDFDNRKKGEVLLKELDCGNWRHGEKEVLECKHITSITYGKKIVYNRVSLG